MQLLLAPALTSWAECEILEQLLAKLCSERWASAGEDRCRVDLDLDGGTFLPTETLHIDTPSPLSHCTA
ncbi:hypothetical protein HJFPF1_10461 [Paramyrothecium foliicola]|nr:hypothetical protein HJFPF1_10461 [Paramyrothecium foliicola]